MKNKNTHTTVAKTSHVKNAKASTTKKVKGWTPWLIKLAVFSIVLVSVVAYTDKKHYFETTEYYKALSKKRWESYYTFAKKNPVDILLLGNSHAYTGVDPEYLSTILGCNMMILGDAGIPVIDSYFTLVEALKVSTPRLVVLETFGMNRDIDETNKQATILCFSARKDFWSKFTSMFYLFSPEDYLPAWSSTLRNHSYLLNGKDEVSTSLLFYKRTHLPHAPLYQGEYRRYDHGMSDSTLHLYDSLGSSWTPQYYNFDETNQYYAKKIIDLCAEKGIQVMLLTTPIYHKNATQYPSWRKENLSKYKALNVPWLDLQYDYDSSVFTPDAFEDIYEPNQHMTIQGAIWVSHKLASFIQSMAIDLPDRTSEQEWLNNFYAKNGYFENQAPLPDDTQARLLAENIQTPQGNILRLILTNNTLIAQVENSSDKPAHELAIPLLINYQGQNMVAVVQLEPMVGHETVRRRVYAASLRPEVQVLGLAPQGS